MKYLVEDSLNNFNAWSGGKDTLEELTESQIDSVENLIEEYFGDTPTDTEINDFLWFERDTIAQHLGFSDWEHLNQEEEEEEEEEDKGARSARPNTPKNII